jgi:hypothetical protein
MVICEKCFQSYPDDAVPDNCQVCGAELKKPVAVAAAVANVVRPAPQKREPVRQEEAPVRRLEPPVRREEPRKEEPPVRHPPPREDTAEAPVRERRAEEAGEAWNLRPEPSRTPVFRTVEPVAALDQDDKPLDPRYLETISSFDENEAIVTVIGFSASGKTFFVNRLRHDLAGAWKRKPAPAEEIPVSPEGIELTWFLPAGGKPLTGRNLSYLLLDCAGESFQNAFRSQGRSDELKGQSVRAYLAALAFASAFILVIRTEDLLAFSAPDLKDEPEDVREEKRFIRKMVADFDDIIHAIVIAKNRLAKQGAEEFLRQGISREEFKAAFRSQERCAQPLYVGLSLADRLRFRGDEYDADPFLFALRHAPTLFKTIHRSFDHYRFDYLTAFHGHDEAAMEESNPKAASWRPHYSQPSYGAVEGFEWIHGLVRSSRGRWAPAWLSSDVPTRQSVELRRRIDPVFRQAWGPR